MAVQNVLNFVHNCKAIFKMICKGKFLVLYAGKYSNFVMPYQKECNSL